MCENSITLGLKKVQQQLATIQAQLSAELADKDRLQRELDLRNAALDAGTSHFMIMDARQPHDPIVYVNRALARAHGYEPEELIGKTARMLMRADSIGLEEQRHMRARLAAGEEIRADLEVLRRDGTTFWVGFTTTAIRNEDGEITHLVAVAADITARREAERKRNELQERLYSEMRERERMAIELRLAQKLESVGRLAAGLAHEINTPIQYLSDSIHFLRSAFDDFTRIFDAYRAALAEGCASTLAQSAPEIAALEREVDYEFLHAEVPRAFERTLEGADRVAGIVRAMKEFAHPDTNEHSPADLNHAIETTIVVCRNEYKYVAELTTDFTTLPPVMCNVGELNQVFLNLIVNAAHAIHDSGKQGAGGRIHIATRLVDRHVQVVIADNGCGIAPANIEKIFDPFFTTKEVGRGTGQGLAIARSIVVAKHGGDIRVESEPGVGTKFILMLPLERQRTEVAA